MVLVNGKTPLIRVVAVSKTRCVVLNKWVCKPPEQIMNIVQLTRGDGTVPARSAARMRDPFLPPITEFGPQCSRRNPCANYTKNALQHSASVGHTELVKHPDVLAGILQALGAPTNSKPTDGSNHRGAATDERCILLPGNRVAVSNVEQRCGADYQHPERHPYNPYP